MNNKIYKMSFSKVYPLLIAKAEKKGRTRDEIDEITCWLTGYSKEQIADFLVNDVEYGEFFLNAPQLNPNRKMITGKICGIRVEEIEEPCPKCGGKVQIRKTKKRRNYYICENNPKSCDYISWNKPTKNENKNKLKKQQ